MLRLLLPWMLNQRRSHSSFSQITLLGTRSEEAVYIVNQVSRNLGHPLVIGRRRPTGKADSSGLRLDDEQQVKRHQSASRPDVDRREVDGR